MQARKILALLLSAVLALAMLAGCSGANHARVAASAANVAQGENQQIEFVTDSKLTRALRVAVEKGESLTAIRQTMLDELGLDAVNFTVSGMRTVKSGQYAAQVYLQTGENASAAATAAASEIYSVIRRLPADGSYTGSIAMIQTDAGYYVAALVYVVDAGTSSNDDDDEPAAPVLERIGVTENPSVMTYVVGQTFDPTGMVVTAYYSDGSSNDVTDYTITCNAFDENSAFTVSGTQQIVITYQGMTTSITVTVEPVTMTLTVSGSYATEYDMGDRLDTQNMVVTASYNNGDPDRILTAEEYTVTSTALTEEGTFTAAGVATITISYTNDNGITGTATIMVTVKPGITMDGTYFQDGELDQIISRFETEAADRGLAVGTEVDLQYTMNQLLSQQSKSENFAPALQNALGAPVYRANPDGKENFKKDISSISYCSFFTSKTGEPVERNGFFNTMFSGKADSIQGDLKTIQDMIEEIDAAEEEGHTNSYTVYISVCATRANYIRYDVLLERTRT